MEKATFKDLLARKLQKESTQLKIYEIQVKSMGKSLLFKRPSDELRIDMMDEVGDGKDIRLLMAMYKKLIYLTCPILQDTKLHEVVGVIDPLDTVGTIFDLDDITDIGEQLMDCMNGFGEEIKN